MKEIVYLSFITLKGGMKDRAVFNITALSIILMFFTPLFASFSMRQITAVAVSFSLSAISFIGLLVTLFVGVNLLAKELDRRTVYTVISLPISRTQYFLGKFLGLISLIFTYLGIMSIFFIIAIWFARQMYPQTINSGLFWKNYVIALLFIYIKCIIIASVVFFFSSVATSSLFPLLLGFVFYFIGESIEEVKLYIDGAGKQYVNEGLAFIAKFAYYIFPNLGSFDFKPQAIYGLNLGFDPVVPVFIYGLCYIGIILTIGAILFRKREFL